MNPAVRALSDYAAYHRDKRNIFTHFIGIPMIWLAIASLIARPAWPLDSLPFVLSPLVIVGVLLCAYYFILHRTLGWIMLAVMVVTYLFGTHLAAQSTGTWLGVSLGMFVIGWIIQFIGHYYEQRKPAFFDDIRGLIIGPLFVAAEVCFLLGGLKDLQHTVEREAGPTVIKARP